MQTDRKPTTFTPSPKSAAYAPVTRTFEFERADLALLMAVMFEHEETAKREMSRCVCESYAPCKVCSPRMDRAYRAQRIWGAAARAITSLDAEREAQS